MDASAAQPAKGTPSDPLQQIADSVRATFGDLIAGDQLNIKASEMWLEIELSSNLLFASGDSLPSNPAFGLMEKVAKILAPFKNPIQVQGYTERPADQHGVVSHQLGAVGKPGPPVSCAC